jgi:hypothetical protein
MDENLTAARPEKEEEGTVNNKEISQAVVARLPRYYR